MPIELVNCSNLRVQNGELSIDLTITNTRDTEATVAESWYIDGSQAGPINVWDSTTIEPGETWNYTRTTPLDQLGMGTGEYTVGYAVWWHPPFTGEPDPPPSPNMTCGTIDTTGGDEDDNSVILPPSGDNFWRNAAVLGGISLAGIYIATRGRN